MGSASRNPVYNARNQAMRISVGACRFFLVFFVLLQAGVAQAVDWQGPASQLAQRIAAITGPGAVAVTVVNRSSLSPADVDEVRRKLLSELAAYGVQASGPEQAAASVQVSLSNNVQNYVWVANVAQGNGEPVVVMISVPGVIAAMGERSFTPLSIRKTLLWTSESRILDVAVIDGKPSHMIVLQPESIGLYRLQDGKWQQEQILAVVHVRPWPRDLRGRLILRKDHLFDAYLPGVLCRSSTAAPLTVTCDDSDDPWPLSGNPGDPRAFFSGTRNFFTGALSPGIQQQTNAPAFYTAATLPRDMYTLWVFAGMDGRVHFLDGVTDQAFALPWGSDIASVRSGCGAGLQILTTSNEDGPADMARAFEILDREAVAVSPPADFQGKITTLWPNSEATSVTAVLQKSETGKYEAYRLAVDCHQ